jgi:hypothetical protein
VFVRFQKAVARDKSDTYKTLLAVVRVAASDNDTRCKKMWKELSGGK